MVHEHNMFQYKDHVRKVLQWLWKAGLYTKAEKCKFHYNSIEYLGYILSLSRLSISSNKIKIIQNWPKPRKIKDMQAFLGFTNFYYRFIYNYSNIATPLINWLRRTLLGISTSHVIKHSSLLQFSPTRFPMLRWLWKLMH